MRNIRHSVLVSGIFAGLAGLAGCADDSIDERAEAGFNEMTAEFHRNYASVEVKEKDCMVVYHIPRAWIPKGVEPKDYLFTEDYKRKCEESRKNDSLRK
jgi:hypothetical protein